MKASMTSLPPVRRKSPLCESMIVRPGCLAMPSAKGLAAVVGGRGAGRALQLDDAALAAGLLGQPLGGHAAFLEKIGTDEAGVKRLVGRLAIVRSVRSPGCRRAWLAEHGVPAGLDERREHDGVDLPAQ
jgi:hypothetical protein